MDDYFLLDQLLEKIESPLNDLRSKAKHGSMESGIHISQKERVILFSLYENTNGDNRMNNDGWEKPLLHSDSFAMPGTESSWFGIQVGRDIPHVESLIYEENKLCSKIPKWIGDLSKLHSLKLQNNGLSGKISSSITKLKEIYKGIVFINNNALFINKQKIKDYLALHNTGLYKTQTCAAENLKVLRLDENTVKLSWFPVVYPSGSEGYNILQKSFYDTSYKVIFTSTDKRIATCIVNKLDKFTLRYRLSPIHTTITLTLWKIIIVNLQFYYALKLNQFFHKNNIFRTKRDPGRMK